MYKRSKRREFRFGVGEAEAVLLCFIRRKIFHVSISLRFLESFLFYYYYFFLIKKILSDRFRGSEL